MSPIMKEQTQIWCTKKNMRQCVLAAGRTRPCRARRWRPAFAHLGGTSTVLEVCISFSTPQCGEGSVCVPCFACGLCMKSPASGALHSKSPYCTVLGDRLSNFTQLPLDTEISREQVAPAYLNEQAAFANILGHLGRPPNHGCCHGRCPPCKYTNQATPWY